MSLGSVILEDQRSAAQPTMHAATWSGGVRTRAGAVLLAAAIFFLDAFTRDDLANASLYVLVPLIVASERTEERRRAIIVSASACAALSMVGYAIFQTRGAPPLALAHLGISLTVLLVTSALLLRANAMDATVERSERRYRSIFDTLAIAIWEHDFTPVAAEIRRLREGGVSDLRRHLAENPGFVVEMRRLVRITDVNATALRMMGVATKEAFFARLSDFLPETDESFAECIMAIDERRPLFQAETVVTALSGEAKDIIVAFGLDAGADLGRVPGSILDISQRRSLEAQVVRSREDLAHAQRSGALAAMSASIAHELNQPMSAIHSYADAARRWMARTPPDMKEASSALTGLVQAVGHARTVMHRVRSLVGNSRLDDAEIDLEELLSTTVELMRRDAADARTRLALLPNPDRPVIVRGDRILLKQVFVNLITNAIQAMSETDPGNRVVTIEVEVGSSEVVVGVSDRGPGWDVDAEANVFGSFYTTKPHGMGLGLSISRTTVERHGGTIALRSGEGVGAVVEVVLPIASGGAVGADGVLDGDLEEVAVQRLVE